MAKKTYKMEIASDFAVRVSTTSKRVSFQFSVSGTQQSGVSYVTRNVSDEAGSWDEAAQDACNALCKRAGAETATLHAIVPPVR